MTSETNPFELPTAEELKAIQAHEASRLPSVKEKKLKTSATADSPKPNLENLTESEIDKALDPLSELKNNHDERKLPKAA